VQGQREDAQVELDARVALLERAPLVVNVHARSLRCASVAAGARGRSSRRSGTQATSSAESAATTSPARRNREAPPATARARTYFAAGCLKVT
jgi:hypothetical protein